MASHVHKHLRWARLLTAALLLGGRLMAQESMAEATVGYIRIFTDTDLVQIYLDGEMIGYTPILEKIAVTPGWHHLSFFSPEFKWEHWTHRQRKVLMNVVEAGTRRIAVEPGELVEVNMEWHALERRLQEYESGRVISALVGMGLVAVSLLLLALAL